MAYPSPTAFKAGLLALIALQATMLASLFAGVPPHPPNVTPLFGIGPFVGAALAAALAGVVLGSEAGPAGRALGVLAAAMALVSFGPHKLLDPQFPMIWPSVVGGFVASGVVIAAALRPARARDARR